VAEVRAVMLAISLPTSTPRTSTIGVFLRSRNAPSGRPRHWTGNTASARTPRDPRSSAIDVVSGCVLTSSISTG